MVKKPGCVKQTDKKYLDRDSPPYPANQCLEHTKKKGNDGNRWYVVHNKKGIGRWVDEDQYCNFPLATPMNQNKD